MILRRTVARQCRSFVTPQIRQQRSRGLATETNFVERAAADHFGVSNSSPPPYGSNAGQSARGGAQASLDRFNHKQHLKQTSGHYGADIEPHYRPSDLLANPPTPADVTLELLLASQAHLGHSTSLWHPANSKYIFGVREGIHVISLDVTAAHLRRAAKVVETVAENGGLILFVGTRSGQSECIVRAAELARGYHLFEKWTPGTITNAQLIVGRGRQIAVDQFDRELDGYDDQLHNRTALKPDLVVCMNTVDNYTMLHECGIHGIPTIGVVDTDTNPGWVTYPIPANDDSLRCIEVIAGVLGRAGEAGHANRMAFAEAGLVTYDPADLPAVHEPRLSATDLEIIGGADYLDLHDEGYQLALDQAEAMQNSRMDLEHDDEELHEREILEARTGFDGEEDLPEVRQQEEHDDSHDEHFYHSRRENERDEE